MEDTESLPNWIRQNPERFQKRLKEEAKLLYKDFPNLGFYRDGLVLYIEGPVVSRSFNAYRIRVRYPEEYPYAPAEGYVLDQDVRDYARNISAHTLHHYGDTGDEWGMQLCLQDISEWKINDSGISIAQFTILWLNAYEFFRIKGYWPLRAGDSTF